MDKVVAVFLAIGAFTWIVMAIAVTFTDFELSEVNMVIASVITAGYLAKAAWQAWNE